MGCEAADLSSRGKDDKAPVGTHTAHDSFQLLQGDAQMESVSDFRDAKFNV